jgi:fido (protein-threonine AMPylation protein)
MDWFIPVLILSIFFFFLLWYHEIKTIGGAYGTAFYFAALFGVHAEYVRRQVQQRATIAEETGEWLNREVERVYQGNQDPSGKIFKGYTKLFTNLASLDPRTVAGLTAKQNLLQPNRPFRAAVIKDILGTFGQDMTFNSNAIEGNPLTAKETNIILSGFSVGRGRKLRDVYDILGHQKAFDEALELVRSKTDLTVDHLKQLHKMVLFESKDGGLLRSGMEIAMISGEKKLFAPPWEVENLLMEFVRWISRSTANGVHPFLLAVSCHTIFVRIHPFRDGNGRMARLLMNYVLLRAGYPALIVRNAKKRQYFEALRAWDAGETHALTQFMLEMLEESFATYFRVLDVKEKNE